MIVLQLLALTGLLVMIELAPFIANVRLEKQVYFVILMMLAFQTLVILEPFATLVLLTVLITAPVRAVLKE